MDELEIWAIDDSQIVRLERTEMDLESSLEDTLVAHSEMLQPSLKWVGRQLPVGDGYLDLLGVDREGRLIVCELKRGTLSRDAVAQVIDYGSALESMNLNELVALIEEYSGHSDIAKIENFEDWYREEFGETLDLLRPLSMYLVGLGTDETTRRMIDFLAEAGLDISLLTLYGFDYGNKTLLAKQVQVESASNTVTSGLAKTERLRALEKRAQELDASELWESARQLIWDDWSRVVQGKFGGLYEGPRANGTTFELLVRKESGKTSGLAFLAVELDVKPSGVEFVYYPRAVDICKDRFDQVSEEDESFERRAPLHAAMTERVNEEMVFHFRHIDEWNARRDLLSNLTQSVFRAWVKREERLRSNVT